MRPGVEGHVAALARDVAELSLQHRVALVEIDRRVPTPALQGDVLELCQALVPPGLLSSYRSALSALPVPNKRTSTLVPPTMPVFSRLT